MTDHFANVDLAVLGKRAKELVLLHIENPEAFNAEFILSALVNECFKQEIEKISG